MAAPAFRGIGTDPFGDPGVWNNGGAPITPTFPPGWQPNDYAMLGWTSHGGSLVTEPTGWTLIESRLATGAGGTVHYRLYERVLQAGDSPPTLDNDTAEPHHAWIASWYHDNKVIRDITGAWQQNTNNGTTSNAPSIIPSAGERTVLVLGAMKTGSTAISCSGTPAATERADVQDLDQITGPESTCWDFFNTFDGLAGTGTRTLTWSQGGTRVSIQVSIKPAVDILKDVTLTRVDGTADMTREDGAATFTRPTGDVDMTREDGEIAMTRSDGSTDVVVPR